MSVFSNYDQTFNKIKICLETLNDKSLAAWLEHEHPQTIAAVFSLCEANKSATLLKLMPEALQSEILLRLDKMEEIKEPELRNIYEELLKIQLKQDTKGGYNPDGFHKILAMLQSVPAEQRKKLLLDIEKKSEELSTKLKHELLTLIKLSTLHPKHLNLLCSSLTDKELSFSLKLEEQIIQERFLQALSHKRRECVEDLLKNQKILKKDAEQAQRSIIDKALELAEKQKIVFPWEETLV